MAVWLQNSAFIIVHYVGIWLVISFILSGLALWRLAALLHRRECRRTETRLAFLLSILNLGLGIALWLLSGILS